MYKKRFKSRRRRGGKFSNKYIVARGGIRF